MQIKSSNWHKVVEGNEIPYDCLVEITALGRNAAIAGLGGYVSTPDSSSISIVGDIDIRVEFALDQSAVGQTVMLASKGTFGGSATDTEWVLYLVCTQGTGAFANLILAQVWFQWYANGTTVVEVVNPVGLYVAPGQSTAVRVTLDVDNGSAQHVTQMYIANHLGNFITGGYSGPFTVTTAGVTSIFNGAGDLLLCNTKYGTGAAIPTLGSPLFGGIFKVELRNGIAGTLVANPDFTAQTRDLPFTDSTGTVWTFVGAYLGRRGIDEALVIDFSSMALEAVQIQRDMTTDVPANTRTITGYPTAQATILLSGHVLLAGVPVSIASLMNPWNQSSPYYLTDWTEFSIVVQSRVYVNGVPDVTIQFTGRIFEPSQDHVTGGIKLTCIDSSDDKLRNGLVLPPVANPMDQPIGGGFVSKFNPGLTGLYILDTLLRNNHIYSSPGPRANCVFYASLAGSAFPQIYRKSGLPPQASYGAAGGFWLTSETDMVFVDGQFNSQVCRDFSTICSTYAGPWDTQDQAIWLGGLNKGITAEWWMLFDITNVPFTGAQAGFQFGHNTPGSGSYFVDYFINVAIANSSGTTWFVAVNDGTNFATSGSFTVTAAWHQITMQITYPGGSAVQMDAFIDGVQVVTALVLTTAAPLPNAVADVMLAGSSLPCEAMQVTYEFLSTPTVVGSFIPGAVLDASLNNLVGVVETLGQNPWQIVQQVVEAELGFAGFDENDVFRFYNRNTLNNSTSVRTISSRSSLKAVETTSQKSAVANWVQVPYLPLGLSSYQAIWSCGDTEYFIPPRGIFFLFVTFENPVIGLSTQTGVIPSGGIINTSSIHQALSGFRAAKKADGSGGQVTTGINIVIRQLSPTTARLDISSNLNYPVYLVTPPGFPTAQGVPCLSLGGEFLTAIATAPDTGTTTNSEAIAEAQWPPIDQGGAASNPSGPIQVLLSSNPWRQKLVEATALADDVLADLYQSRPVLQNVVITMDASLQLADRVTLVDPDKSKLNDDAQVFSITTNMSKTDATQALNLKTIGGPGAWVMGIVGHSEMGVNTRV